MVNLAIFCILLNYLIVFGFRNLVLKNIFIVVIITSGIVIIGFVMITSAIIFIKEYFIISEYVVGKFLKRRQQEVIEVETIRDGRIFD